jgi:hypothetical protein
VPWTAEFTVTNGEGYDTSATTIVNAEDLTTDDTGHTNDFTVTSSFTLAGSKAPKPVITLEIVDADAAMNGIEYPSENAKAASLLRRLKLHGKCLVGARRFRSMNAH